MLEDAEQKLTEFNEELVDQEGRLQKITIMKSTLLKLNATRHADKEKHQRQMELLKKELTSAIASSKNAVGQAKSQIAECEVRLCYLPACDHARVDPCQERSVHPSSRA
uniref:Uncharacterized protein n=1 Tax=Hyaloperonospora arabidopsidis (strain Emoy2) TaxID=559515 RepID=M4BX72_HYAAE